jgi:hypothetical protein
MWSILSLLSFDVFGKNVQQFDSKNALEILVNTKVIYGKKYNLHPWPQFFPLFVVRFPSNL